MDDLDVLARDFGFGPRVKSNPMKSHAGDLRTSSVPTSRSDNHSNRDDHLFGDVFGGPSKNTNTTTSMNNRTSLNDFDYGSIFESTSGARDSKRSNENTEKTSSLPVYDKPVYDEDIFDGLPGLKSKSPVSSERFDNDVFVSMASPPNQRNNSSTADHFDDLLGNLTNDHKSNNKNPEAFDDLLGNFGKNERVTDGSKSGRSSTSKGLNDFLGAFGSGSPVIVNRSASNHGKKSAGNASQSASNTVDDPFVDLESTSAQVSSSEAVPTNPLEDIDKPGKLGNTKTDSSSGRSGVFDDIDPLNRLRKSSAPSPSPEVSSNRGTDTSPRTQSPANNEHAENSSYTYPESRAQSKVQDDNFQDSPVFDMPIASQRYFNQSAFSSPHTSANKNETSFQSGMPPRSEDHLQTSDDAWLTVSEIPLFTQPTRAPPPSRPPPPIPRKTKSKKDSSFSPSDLRNRGYDFASPLGYTSYSQVPEPQSSEIDELDDFARGSTKNNIAEEASTPLGEEVNASSVAAAAMKEAMDKAEAKFKHAKEVREREYAKAAKTKESVHLDRNEDAQPDAERLEKERERAREIEREKARQAVERATREARERAAAEARLRAERAAVGKVQNEARERAERVAVGKVQNEARERAERAAVGKVQTEARERAERAAVHRAQAEARERAAAEARERQEKIAAEVREREAREKAAEARRRAERNAVERAAAEARERAATEARERAAVASRVNQQKTENDVESFFKADSRANSVPKARDNSFDSIFDPPPFRDPGKPQGPKTTNAGSSPNMTKSSSSTNFVDDLSSIFGVAQPGDFTEAEGETEERRNARFERHQRTQERAAKALAEKNQRDINAQREQEERHRFGEALDMEIKRWSAGKEGNLRALLSTLQYVLWPECGWQPISLTDLIVGANVKKSYRKATLCIHPDKVQQKGATLQQKYIAEKVFDLLKEAWNKFNSEELF